MLYVEWRFTPFQQQNPPTTQFFHFFYIHI
jgi:hypothetical protein